MIKRIAIAVLLLALPAVHAETNDPAISEESERDAYLREREEYHSAMLDVEQLIKAGKLEEAERAVERYEPKYAHKWSVGRFGYGTRMQIAQAYLDRGDRREALRLFKAAKPGGGCGNCMASQHVRRNIRVARIHESRFNFPAAFASYLGAIPSTALGGGFLHVLVGLTYSGAITLAPIFVLVYFLRRRHKRKEERVTGQQSPAGDVPKAAPEE